MRRVLALYESNRWQELYRMGRDIMKVEMDHQGEYADAVRGARQL